MLSYLGYLALLHLCIPLVLTTWASVGLWSQQS